MKGSDEMNSCKQFLIKENDNKTKDMTIDAINQLIRQTVQMKLILNNNMQKSDSRIFKKPPIK